MIQELQKNYEVGEIVVVADKDLNAGNNIVYNNPIGNGYVMSLSIRGSIAEMKKFVLDETGYEYNAEKTYKKKSRLYPREVIVTKKIKMEKK